MVGICNPFGNRCLQELHSDVPYDGGGHLHNQSCLKRKLRIAFVTPEFVTEERNFDGGLSNYLYRVSISLATLGHEPTVIVASDCDREFTLDGIHVCQTNTSIPTYKEKLRQIVFGDKIGDPSSWRVMGERLSTRLRRMSRKHSFDIVQYSSYGALALYRMLSKPTVVRLSSYEKLRREALEIENSNSLETEYEALEKSGILCADAIYGPSRWTAEKVGEDIGRRVEVIKTPMMFDCKNLDYSRAKELTGKRYFLFYGSLWRLKGVDLLLDVTDEFFEQFPSIDLVIIGKDLGSREDVYKKIKKHERRIFYFDKMPHSQLYPIISGALAVVLPSRYDNCPNAALEAMAHRRVVIGTRASGSFDELIEDGVNGILCNPGSAYELLGALKRVAEMSDEARSSIGQRAEEKLSSYHPDRANSDLIRFYFETISAFSKRKRV